MLARPSEPERVPAAPLPFGRVLGLDLLYSSCSFKPRCFFVFFFWTPGQLNQLLVSQYGPPPAAPRVRGQFCSVYICLVILWSL